jgi:subtilisin family serine protease
MKYSGLILILLASSAVFFFAPSPALSNASTNYKPDLFVYRWKDGPPKEVSREAVGAVHKISLGLTNRQIQALFKVTNGQVDLAGLYSLRQNQHLAANRTVESFADSSANGPVESSAVSLTEYPGLLDRIMSGAPPPYMANVPFVEGLNLLVEELVNPDPELKDQWWLDRLRVREAWNLATGRGVTIADCDAGFHISDPDIRDNLVLEKRYSITNTKDPLNVETGRFIGHGTSVSAIMAARLDGKGTNGIAFNSKVVPLQNYTYDPTIDKMDKEEATAQCVLKAISTEAVQIIVIENQTHGSSESFAGTREAVRLALQSGITIVSTAGNSNHELKDEAADDTDSIIVGAVNMSDEKQWYSNYGSRVVIAAFGERVRTLTAPGTYGEFGGTSAATPQVAATIAMMLEVNPKITPRQIKTILRDTRITIPKNTLVGGRVDTLAAVQAAKSKIPDQEGYTRANETRRLVNEILHNP